MMQHRQYPRAAYALATFVVLGCSSGKDALEKRVSSLQEELIAVQNDNDRLSERLMALETQQARAPAAAGESRGEPAEPNLERPPLKVVKLEPETGAKPVVAGEEAVESEDEDTARPVIRDLGSGKANARARATPRSSGQTGAQR